MVNENKFADNPFLIGHENVLFSTNSGLGFVVCEGKFPTEEDFISFEEVVKKIKKNQHFKLILNMGDSSTSGWDSDAITNTKKIKNCKKPFFNYKTYSDILRKEGFNVINAGVSGYSSYQGVKYTKQLLKKLAKEKIIVDCVTIYFGNNDSVYSPVEDKSCIDYKKPSPQNLYRRVSTLDYEKNILEIINTIREYGSAPAIIVPARRYDWKPGLRSLKHKYEYKNGFKKLPEGILKRNLLNAEKQYLKGNLKKAYSLDIFLPRIKDDYIKILKKISRKHKTPLINIQHKIPINKTDKLFCDYCHPLEHLNKEIANEIKKIVKFKKDNYLEKKSLNKPSENVYPLN
ncbi:MAG: GDSL-type esterase/lipase family protein [Nanoarchaeota archaeon]|nr:GDSL-type esterase/lipase family protein [Nanoarchaeota archaeon]